MKKFIIVIILMLTAVSIFSGCTTTNITEKGTYNEKLSEQYIKATQYSVSQSMLEPKLGYTYKIYILPNSSDVNIYGQGVYPDAKEEYVDNSTIDANGVIDIGWKYDSTGNLSRIVFKDVPVPLDGTQYYVYSGPFEKGYNIIVYKKNKLDMMEDKPNSQYAEVKYLGIYDYENDTATLYHFMEPIP